MIFLKEYSRRILRESSNNSNKYSIHSRYRSLLNKKIESFFWIQDSFYLYEVVFPHKTVKFQGEFLFKRCGTLQNGIISTWHNTTTRVKKAKIKTIILKEYSRRILRESSPNSNNYSTHNHYRSLLNKKSTFFSRSKTVFISTKWCFSTKRDHFYVA